MRKFFFFLLGAITGALVGSTIALLFAPQSGGEMRNQIKDYTTRTMDEIRMASHEKRIQLEKQLSELRKPSVEKPI